MCCAKLRERSPEKESRETTHRVCTENLFAIELENQPKHSVRGRMLRATASCIVSKAAKAFHCNCAPKVNWTNIVHSVSIIPHNCRRGAQTTYQ